MLVTSAMDSATHSQKLLFMLAHNLSKLPPKKILLATDLSARGDRALDRAAQLANQWKAELVIVHALDGRGTSLSEAAYPLPSWRRITDPSTAIRDRIMRDLREEVDQLKILIEKGEPAQVILDTASREDCDLIIVGLSQNGLVGQMLLGRTVEHLVRKSPVSVLVVKSRPAGAYRHVLVGTDFTEESRYGLEVAACSFPDCQFTVMHGFEMQYKAFLPDSMPSQESTAMEKQSIEEFVRDAEIGDKVRAHTRTLVEHGPPDLMLCRYVEEQHADLVVIGAYGRGFLFHLLVGGYTPRIVDSVPTDILLVRAQRTETPTKP